MTKHVYTFVAGIIGCLLICWPATAQITKTIHLNDAGTLQSYDFGETPANTVTHFVVTGAIDARDVRFMRDSMTVLEALDLTGTTVVAYSGTEGTQGNDNRSYSANTMPTYSFRYKTSLTSLLLPSGITGIEYMAFSGCSGLTSIELPDGVTQIPSEAFSGCTGLTSIELPDGLTLLGGYAFRGCSSLTSITIPDGVTILEDYVFANCRGLTSVILPDGITTIETNAFYDCTGLVSIDLPDRLTSLQSGVFQSCTSLASITIPDGVTAILNGTFYNCPALTTVHLPEKLTTIESNAFSQCTHLTSILLPRTVTTIGAQAFYCCTALASITNLNPTPQSINSNVFEGHFIAGPAVDKTTCELKVPAGSLAAYQAADVWKDFLNTTGGVALTVVKNKPLGSLSGTSTGIYDSGAAVNVAATPSAGYDFYGWLANEDTLTTNPTLSFTLVQDTVVTAHFGKDSRYTLIEAGTLKDIAGVKTSTTLTLSGRIDARDIRFMRDSMPTLEEIDLSRATIVYYSGTEGTNYGTNSNYGDNTMPDYSFSRYYNYSYIGKTTLRSIKLPAGVTVIGNYAFDGCTGLLSVELPNGLQSIYQSAFLGCYNLPEITLPPSLTYIGYYAFMHCEKITSLVLPAGVTTISPFAFWSCTGLTTLVNLNPTPVSIVADVFLSVNTAACELKVPSGSVNAYRNAAVWKTFRITGGVVLTVSASNSALGSVSGAATGIYDSGTTLQLTAHPAAGYEFMQWISGGSVLATTPELSLTLTQDTVVTAYFGKSGNHTLTTVNTLKDIAGIKEITHLTLSGYIDARDVRFMRDSIPFLTELDLTDATIVAYSGTEGTVYGTDRNYPANEMPGNSFFNPFTGAKKYSLRSVKFPAGLTSIGYSGFYDCYNLVSVVFPSGLETISGQAFGFCGFRTITLPAGVKTIGTSAFQQCRQLVSITNLNPTPLTLHDNDYVFGNVNTAACTLIVPTASAAAYQAAEVWKDFYVTGDGRVFSAMANNSLLGSISGTANGLYPDGTAISVTAHPAAGYELIQWTSGGAVLATTPELSLTLTQDTVVTAYFGKPGIYTLTEAGALKDKPGIKAVTFLKISGNIDARDVRFMRDSMPDLTELDLSAATIVAYSGTEGTFYEKDTLYPDHTLPQLSFCTGDLQPKLSLKSVALPASLKAIGRLTFTYCSNLTTVTIPEGIESIDYAAFYSSGITGALHLPPRLHTLGDLAFTACSNITGALILPDEITSLGTAVFQNCFGLTSLHLPAQLTFIGDYAFSYCINMNGPLVIPSGVTTIGHYAFTNCRFTGTGTLELPAALTSIGSSAFNLLSVTSLTLPANLTTIGSAAFRQCSNLAVITNLNPTPASITDDVFQEVDKNACELKVPATSLAAYQAAPVWKDFLRISGEGFIVNVTANNSAYGSVSGGGLYAANATATLTATAFSGHKFVNWTSGGNEVSAANPYSFTVTQDITLVANFIAKSNDANLQTLTVSAGTLEPVFNATTTNYTVSVANNVNAITLSATAADAAATVSGDVGNRTLQVGANTFTVTVTAEDGTTTKDYTVVVSRADAPVTLTAMSLNGGAFVAVFRTVNLQFTFTGGSPTHFMAGENANLSGAAWQAYTPGALTYSLASDAIGNKTVYAKLKNEVGETGIVSDIIYYKPLHAKLSLTAFGVSNGATCTTQREVTLNHTVENGVPTHYSVSEKREQIGQAWLPYVPEPVYTLSEKNGPKEVFFAVANATDTSETVSDRIYLDESETLESHGLTASLFPNPVSDVLHVVIEDETVTSVQVSVYTITGGVCLSQTFHSRSFDIDMSRYPSGTWVVKLSGEKGYVIKQIIKN